MSPLAKNLPSYIKDPNHALQIFDQIRFTAPHKFIFTINIKSLYTVIPHRNSVEALKFHFDQRTVLELQLATLLRLAELLLTLNNFSFEGERYPQISGVVMGTKMGSSYANLLLMLKNISLSDDRDFEMKSLEMRSFFVQRGYPSNLLDTAM